MKWFVVVCVSERVSDGGMIAMIFHGDMGLMLSSMLSVLEGIVLNLSHT